MGEPDKMNPKRPTPRDIIIKMAKNKQWENLKNSKLKRVNYLQEFPQKNVTWFLNKDFSGRKRLAWNIQSDKKQVPTTKITLPSKTSI